MNTAIAAALLAFGVPVAILFWVKHLCAHAEQAPDERETFAFLNDHYSKLAGTPVSIGPGPENGTFDCIIDCEDGTLAIGVGDTPFDAYNDAQRGERYLGTM